MNTHFSYSTTYQLDKSHFIETFDESVTAVKSFSAYYKSLAFALIGAIVILAKINGYLGWFLLGLGAVEALSVRFQKPWWLFRQMLSKAANSELTLTIDEQGVASHSYYVDSKIQWSDLTQIERTKQGWLLYQGAAKSYLSNRCLSEQASEFLLSKQAQVNKPNC